MACVMSKKLAQDLKLTYKEINIDEQPDAMDYLIEQGVHSMPYIEYNEEHWVGFQPEKLQALAVEA
mgnify:CR=1 FL=1